jgi:hypothetical protein
MRLPAFRLERPQAVPRAGVEDRATVEALGDAHPLQEVRADAVGARSRDAVAEVDRWNQEIWSTTR